MTVRYPLMENGTIHTIEANPDDGAEILYRIQDKALRYMEKFGREPKFLVIDSQSYLQIYAHFQQHTVYNTGVRFNGEQIMTSVGALTPVVLPQVIRRIQVIGGDSMFTATTTIHENNQ